MAIWCDEFRGCFIVQVRNLAGEVLGKVHEVKYADQLAMVCRGEGALEVKVAKDNILFVGVSVVYAEAEMSDRPRARAVGPETLLLRAEDLASFDVVRG